MQKRLFLAAEVFLALVGGFFLLSWKFQWRLPARSESRRQYLERMGLLRVSSYGELSATQPPVASLHGINADSHMEDGEVKLLAKELASVGGRMSLRELRKAVVAEARAHPSHAGRRSEELKEEFDRLMPTFDKFRVEGNTVSLR